MNTPSPGPGDEHQHLNTQLRRIIEPLTNRVALAEKLTWPHSAPADLRLQLTMDGFVADDASAFGAETGREPGYRIRSITHPRPNGPLAQPCDRR